MTKYVYDYEMSARLNLAPGNDTYLLTSKGKISVDDDWAIYDAPADNRNAVVVSGIVEGGEAQGGIFSEGKNFDLHVGALGDVSGGTAVSVSGNNARIDNDGYIHASSYAISSTSYRVDITNSGLIDGGGGIHAQGHDISIVNDGIIRSSGTGLQLVAGDGDTTSVVNHGQIIANYSAGGYRVGASDDTLINSGRIVGSIDMGAGDDLFDNRGGYFTGTLTGGDGNDVFVTSDNTVFDGGGDTDTVKSTVDYKLYDSTERLFLLGKANIDATGNAGANVLRGNSGNNVLTGLQGNDVLDGGAGNDLLRGGQDGDRFVFATGYDKDTINAFEKGHDHVDVSDWKAIASYSDLKNNHASDHGQDLWITAGSDRLIIEGMHRAELAAGFFIF